MGWSASAILSGFLYIFFLLLSPAFFAHSFIEAMMGFLDVNNNILNGTNEYFVLEHERYGDKYEVKKEHGESEASVHSPLEECYAHYNEDEHAEEYGYAAHHSHWVDLDWLAVDQTVY